MAESSNNPNLVENKQGELKNHARGSSPSFNSNKNKSVNGRPIAAAKKKLLTEGIKKGAQAYGIPEAATQAVLNTETGQEALDAAATAPSVTSGAHEAVKVILKREVYPKILLATIAPFVFIILFMLIIFGKDSFGGMAVGDGTDIYAELREEIKNVSSSYGMKADIDGTLILATLIGYNDAEQLEGYSISDKNMANMKNQVSKLASYQVMTTTACSDDSSTIRKIASNDDLFSEANYQCDPNAQSTSYSVSTAIGSIDDNNSGSVYFWNLIDEEFIFEYYNEYMIDKKNNNSKNNEKIEEIINEIYIYYESLKEANGGKDYFSPYTSLISYWWPIGSSETTIENGKVFAKGEPSSVIITATFAGNDSTHKGSHGALDIGGTKNVDNVIATRAGTVIYPYSPSQTGYGDGCHPSVTPNCVNNRDGGGYGNYVMIDHGDGVYSLYAHMYANTITVFAGDTVEQGQVIGKVGTSGNSTGPHLHFEIRDGGQSQEFKVDPLLYVDPKNPRPMGSDSLWSEWIKQIECASCDSDPAKFDGANYIVYRTPEGSLDVAWGIRLVDPRGVDFKRYTPPDGSPIRVGTKVPKEEVYKLFDRLTEGFKGTVNSVKVKYGITLNSAQDMAMLSLAYNNPSLVDPVLRAYGSGGNTNALWNQLKLYTYSEGVNLLGLKKRRAEEFELFTTGDYKYDPLPGSKVKYYDVNSW